MKVLLGVPHNGTVTWSTSQAVWRCSQHHDIEVANIPSSLLAMSFNILYAEALNRSAEGTVDLFAMLHSDVAPDGYWLDTLISTLLDKDAHLVSAINAIKDERGLTSSGLAIPGTTWKPWCRFTLRELAEYPATFNAADIGYEDMVLLHNTGCWVADLRKPLFHEADEQGQLKAFFTINDRIVRRDGQWRAEVEPEDWFFSRRLHDMGASTYVTREVITHHYGLADCDNSTVRGQQADTELIGLWGHEDREVVDAYL